MMKTSSVISFVLVATVAVAAGARADDGRLGPGVREAVESGARARIVVAFREARAAADQPAVREQEIHEIGAAILSAVGGDFEVTHRWDLVSGMAGWTTARGVDRLLGD